MSELDELGPVDYLVVEFPPDVSNFSGEMAAELAALAEAGTIRLLDLLILQKDDDGEIQALEIDDLDQVPELVALEGEIAEILAADDVVHLAAGMENGSTAGVVVWENLWAAPFASAARRAGGQLIATGRIPVQAIPRGRRGLDQRRSLTCLSVPHAEHAVAASAPPSPEPLPLSAPLPSSRTASTAVRIGAKTDATGAEPVEQHIHIRTRTGGGPIQVRRPLI